MLAVGVAVGSSALALAEQASQPASAAAGGLDLGAFHTCAVFGAGSVRCWGYAGDGQLGYADTSDIGDDETPASAGPVDLGPGRTATAISVGDYHSCALLDGGSVRCWGYGANGRLGYGTSTIGDHQTPASAGPVDLGSGRSATAVAAGGAHTCAILDTGAVLCWGYGANGQLGYATTRDVGDQQTPGAAGPVDLGGRKAVAISAGASHTCVILEGGAVMCWGLGQFGKLGHASTLSVGDDDTPASAGTVDIGAGRKAVAISAGGTQTCVVLDDGHVRCWGWGLFGQLGYGNTDNVGDNEAPSAAGPVDLGPGHSAVAIAAGQLHSCALMDDGQVRCWGFANNGRLGYGNTTIVGDLQAAASAGPVDLGAGRSATAISAGETHTCARLDNGSLRCWGAGTYGRLGYCNGRDIGDDELPGSAGPVELQPGDGGAVSCPLAHPTAPNGPTASGSGVGAAPSPPERAISDHDRAAERSRAAALRRCRRGVTRRLAAERRRMGRLAPRQRAAALRLLIRDSAAGRSRCLRRYGRRPGRVGSLRARPAGAHTIVLSFKAPASNGSKPPPARAYLIKQSRSGMRVPRDVARAPTLCHGACRFDVTTVGANIRLKITGLRPHTVYYYSVAARDNVSGRRGAASPVIRGRTR